MNKKTAVVSVLLGVLLIGIVSAGLIEYFGRITGSVEVEAPVFYLDGHLGGVYYNLLVDEIPSEEEVYLNNGNRLLFVSRPLDVNEFYKTRFDIKIWAKTKIGGNILQFKIIKLKPDFSEEIICTPSLIILTDKENFIKKETSCSSLDIISLNPEDSIGLVIFGAGIDSEYWISVGRNRTSLNDTNGYSRIEVISI